MTEKVLKIQNINDPYLRHAIWEMYVIAFSDTDDHCAQDQICYDNESMDQALQDPDYWKFVLLFDNKPIGLCILTNNLKKARIAYCNDRFLRRKFPKYTAEGRLYYVTAICVLPEMQKLHHGIKLLKEVISFIDENKAMVSYDFSDNKNSNLPDIIIFVAKELNKITIMRADLDRQIYTSLYGQHHGKPS